MPPWGASVPRSTLLVRSRSAIDRLQPKAGYCQCPPLPRSLNRRVRYASTIVSPTEINLRPSILPENKELYKALSELRGAAKHYVNGSRVQLALQGLTAQDAVTRVAVLGLRSQTSAQHLTRLLLADPLGVEEPWEKELDRPEAAQERALLLKYGDEPDAEPPMPQYRVLSLPSRLLKSHNMEILVSTLNVLPKAGTSGATEHLDDSLLVPKLQDSATAEPSAPYPVHKTLVLGVGVDGAIAFGRYLSGSVVDANNMVKVAVDLSVPMKEQDQTGRDGSSTIDMDIGAEALATFRKSIQNSLDYERGWFQSGLPALSTWLIDDLQPSEPMKPVVRNLISSLLSDAESNLAKADALHLRNLQSIPTESDVSTSIIIQLESWAEKSHAELRDQLDDAFAAKSWHGLAWWKLFWRVDDISMVMSDILEQKWLVSAEKSSFFLAGSMNRAGFPDDVKNLPLPNDNTPNTNVLESRTSTEPQEDTTLADTTTTPAELDLSTDVRIPKPWPTHIPTARTTLAADTIPPLQSLAQRLILQTLTTTSISTAISAMLYLTMSSFSVLEASTVAALGLTFSLRRTQKVWEDAREKWQGLVREEGRRTLKDTEEAVRFIVGAYRREKVWDARAVERKEAREAVRRVRRALEGIGEPGEKKGV